MARYQISNQTSGQDLGLYEADDAVGAYLEMLRDAGYSTRDEQGRWINDIPDDISVVPKEAMTLHQIMEAMGSLATEAEAEAMQELLDGRHPADISEPDWLDLLDRAVAMAARVDEMARELREIGAPDYRRHASLMAARWGRDYSDELFDAAAHRAQEMDDEAAGEEI